MRAKDQDWLYELTDGDRSFYRMLLPREHSLLEALELIPTRVAASMATSTMVTCST